MLNTYLADVRHQPLLTHDEELRLARLASTGDEAAKRRLVQSNLRLVVSIARRYQGRGLDLLDLIQEGNLGLLAAAEHYDWRRGVKFATYATWPIRREILRALSTHSRLIRLPLRVAESAMRVKRAEAEVGQRLGRRPSAAEVAHAAGVSEEVVVQLRRAALAPVPLSAPATDGMPALEETLSDDGAADPAALLTQGVDTAELHAALSRLSGRARRLVELRYGVNGERSRTLAEVAGELGLSAERVRKLEARTLHQLAARPELRALRVAA